MKEGNEEEENPQILPVPLVQIAPMKREVLLLFDHLEFPHDHKEEREKPTDVQPPDRLHFGANDEKKMCSFFWI